ncbi:MAG TPA: ABC-F family ATP-binding cassette domain-containing protein [bacterium]|nr:ABC-F family ATP-binding cassette domain-containing protein [bacterium]
MPLLLATDLMKSFAGVPVLAGVSIALEPGEKVGLVGRNGAGKTTVLRILAGLELPDRGAVSVRPGAAIGYLTQSPQVDESRALWDEAAGAFARLQELEQRLMEAEARLASPEVHADDTRLKDTLEEYGRLRERFERTGGFTYEAEIRRTLGGLGLREEQFRQPMASLSGGERSRGALARLLLLAPDLLLLDEPTNHLDLEALEWLQEFLQQYRGAVLLVSHDRSLLDGVTARTLELEEGKLEEYPGNYSFYATERLVRRERRQEAFERQQAEIASLKDYIRRYHAGQKSRQAKSREKRLARITPLAAPRTSRTLSFRLEAPRRTPQTVLRVRNVMKRFGAVDALRQVTFEVRRGEKVGLIGANGSGKTTLLRTIAGLESPTSGAIEVGPGVRLGYFAQHAEETLDLMHSVLDEVLGDRRVTPEQVRTLLGRFLFSGDAVHVPVGRLSGGERRRVALAKMVLDRPDLLLLDEPTTHLDLPSLEALEAALREFPGAMILVTHDRYLLDHVATRLLVLKDGAVTGVQGPYQSYRRAAIPAVTSVDRGEASPADAAPRQTAERVGTRPRQTPGRPSGQRTVGQAPEEIMSQIAALEREQGDLSRLMGDPELYRDADRARRTVRRYEEVSAALESLYAALAAADGEAHA